MSKIRVSKIIWFYVISVFFAVIFTFRLIAILQGLFDSPNPNPFNLLKQVKNPIVTSFLERHPIEHIASWIYILGEIPALILVAYISIGFFAKTRFSLLLLQSSVIPFIIKLALTLLLVFFSILFLSDEESKISNLWFFVKGPLILSFVIFWPLWLLYKFTSNKTTLTITKLIDRKTTWFKNVPPFVMVMFLMAAYASLDFFVRIPLILENLDYVKKFIKFIISENPVSKRKNMFFESAFYTLFYNLIGFYILLPLSILILMFKRRLGFIMLMIVANLFIPMFLIVTLPVVHIANTLIGYKILTATVFAQIILMITLISSYATFLAWQKHRSELSKWFANSKTKLL